MMHTFMAKWCYYNERMEGIIAEVAALFDCDDASFGRNVECVRTSLTGGHFLVPQ